MTGVQTCALPIYIENIVFLVTKDCNEVILHTGAAKLVAINIDSIDKFAEWCKWCKDILTKKEVERLKTQKE